jgi:hypothetical protein
VPGGLQSQEPLDHLGHLCRSGELDPPGVVLEPQPPPLQVDLELFQAFLHLAHVDLQRLGQLHGGNRLAGDEQQRLQGRSQVRGGGIFHVAHAIITPNLREVI